MVLPKRGKTRGSVGSRFTRIRGKAKGKKPPLPLQVRTKPSVRHPAGLPRCQYWDLRGAPGEKPSFFQCSRAARVPTRPCPQHGAGSRKRIRDGIRQDPLTANIQTGQYAKPETLPALFGSKPELRSRYERHIDGADLFDLRPQLATAKTLLEHYLETASMDETMGPKGTDPPILRAVNAARTVVKLAGDMVAIEQGMGPITHADLERLKHVFAECLNRFVRPELRDEAIAFCRDEIRLSRFRNESDLACQSEKPAAAG
jgi:hypothetical protein